MTVNVEQEYKKTQQDLKQVSDDLKQFAEDSQAAIKEGKQLPRRPKSGSISC
ncbi:hypothetical protein A8U91_04734 [Halomonas elongata]|uniref:Uncharacterized protein n=1 Tax=Halomonas elongata TaxID=2746 RepID=A0A1B8P0A2_HALEL|nr:hypothetical protein [Halomonas elongata]OBX35660.1 hypothetical protein A8U91_04734 [Halomonas elongata]